MHRLIRAGQRPGFAAMITAAVALTAACNLPQTSSPAASADSPGTSYGALDQLAELSVEPEDTEHEYDRDNWPHWSQEDGCTTREQVLIEEGEHVAPNGETEPVKVDPETCSLHDGDPVSGTGNQWYSPFDDELLFSPDDIDIDHWVPLEEAAQSGTRHWTRDQRKNFANDPAVLIAVSASSNREKGSQDPAEWLVPDNPSFACEYASTWIQIKHTYEMSVDQAEHDALHQQLTLCATSRNDES